MANESSEVQTEEIQHSEQPEIVQDAAVELSDDQIWESAGIPAGADVIDVDEDPDTAEVEGSESEQESETAETAEVLSEEETLAEDQEDADKEQKKHDYEKRYRDLEKEFHKRNEESKELRDQFQQLRLERLEMEREVERLRGQDTQQKQKDESKKEISPLDDDWIDSDTKQTLEDFSELTAAYKKLIAQEVAKATSGVNQTEKIAELEQVTQDYQQRQYWQRHAAEMRTNVGADFLEIDRCQEFADFVHSSPMREYIMTESSNWNDHIAVMQDFLETPLGKAKFRTDGATAVESTPAEKEPPKPPDKPPGSKISNQGTVRRQAAQGLLKNSSPRQERRPEDMNDEELWDSIAL